MSAFCLLACLPYYSFLFPSALNWPVQPVPGGWWLVLKATACTESPRVVWKWQRELERRKKQKNRGGKMSPRCVSEICGDGDSSSAPASLCKGASHSLGVGCWTQQGKQGPRTHIDWPGQGYSLGPWAPPRGFTSFQYFIVQFSLRWHLPEPMCLRNVAALGVRLCQC